MTDTVAAAQAQPVAAQPFAELGLKDDEYAADPRDPRPPPHRRRAGHVLGDVERALLVQVVQGAPALLRRDHHRRDADALLAGIGENAGVVDIGDGWAVTFKVESHNHPSYVEPYQGAATGVGGIVRDIMAMGARPVAVMDQLRFGAADAPDTRRVLDGVVAASAATATRWACPTSAARSCSTRPTRATRWSTRCASACCATRICTWPSPRAPATRSSCSARAPAATASAASRCWPRRPSTRRAARRKLPSVQVGDPFTEKVLIECCLELLRRRAGGRHPGPRRCRIVLRHLGAGVAGDGGMHIELDQVPLRAAKMTPRGDPPSESQERMCAVVTPENVDAFMAVCAQVGRRWPP